MGLTCYLAMTAQEFRHTTPYPAWMACHFAAGGCGLSNLPQDLPEGTLLILDDATPFSHHDPKRILEQLQNALAWHPAGLLLDLQRPGSEDVSKLCELLTHELPCPVIVSELYAKELTCPVLLSPPPLLTTLSKHLAPWTGREIWLEAALDGQVITVTEEGSTAVSCDIGQLPTPWFQDKTYFCRYHWVLEDRTARFTLIRTREDLQALLDTAEKLGVKGAVGLYQELKEPTV